MRALLGCATRGSLAAWLRAAPRPGHRLAVCVSAAPLSSTPLRRSAMSAATLPAAPPHACCAARARCASRSRLELLRFADARIFLHGRCRSHSARGGPPPHAAAKPATSGEEEAQLVEMEAARGSLAIFAPHRLTLLRSLGNDYPQVERFEKCVDSVKRAFGSVRTGRASASLLDRIVVDYYGAPTPLRQMASMSTPDASTINIQPFDKGTIKEIERAINSSDLGLTPGNDGQIIRLVIPQLTEARRKELAKTVGKLAEEGKVAVRNVRRDALKSIDKLEKDKLLSEDGAENAKEALQKRTDEAVKQVDSLVEAKTKDLMSV